MDGDYQGQIDSPLQNRLIERRGAEDIRRARFWGEHPLKEHNGHVLLVFTVSPCIALYIVFFISIASIRIIYLDPPLAIRVVKCPRCYIDSWIN